mmetsp:Transcript_29201/g.90736  ORF Transcript_29201/g.90736 Transcript_29201/m.90736 type:complete len:441 (-) Transcript_29201:18-1340(-)
MDTATADTAEPSSLPGQLSAKVPAVAHSGSSEAGPVGALASRLGCLWPPLLAPETAERPSPTCQQPPRITHTSSEGGHSEELPGQCSEGGGRERSQSAGSAASGSAASGGSGGTVTDSELQAGEVLRGRSRGSGELQGQEEPEAPEWPEAPEEPKEPGEPRPTAPCCTEPGIAPAPVPEATPECSAPEVAAAPEAAPERVPAEEAASRAPAWAGGGERPIPDRYAALLVREFQERKAVEERLEEEHAARLEARSTHRAVMEQLEREQYGLLQEQLEKARRLEAQRISFQAQAEELHAGAWRGKAEFLESRRQAVGCQCLLLRELQAVLRRTEALKKDLVLRQQLRAPPYLRAAIGLSGEGPSSPRSPECSPAAQRRHAPSTSPCSGDARRGSFAKRVAAAATPEAKGERPKTNEDARHVDAYVRHMLAYSRRARLSEWGG